MRKISYRTEHLPMRRKPWMAGIAVFVGILAMSSVSHASQWCKGQVTSVLTDSGGNVMVFTTFRQDWLQVCNITVLWKGVTTDVCKSWLGTLTALRLAQEPAVLFYTEDTACSAIASYGNAPAPNYVAIDTP